MNSSNGDRRRWERAVILVALAGVFFVVTQTAADPDLWGHVLFGLDMLRERSIPVTDPYSYLTFGHPWINHELLAEVAFGTVFTVAGSVGLMILKVTVAMAIAMLLYHHLLRRGLDPARGGILLVLIVWAMLPALGTIRPHMFTYLFFLLLLLILSRVDDGHRRWIWAVPPLIALWINFHGGVLAGLGVVALWAAVQAILLARRGASRASVGWAVLIGVVLLSGLATLANPYGWRLPEFLLRTATGTRLDISEWRPLDLRSLFGFLYLALVAAGVWALVKSSARRGPAMLVVLAATAVLPLLARRHLPLFVLTYGVVLADHFADAWKSRAVAASEDGSPPSARLRTVSIWLTLATALILVAAAAPRFLCIPIKPGFARGFPVRAVRLLHDSGVGGNLGMYFTWGEYAIWHLQPRIRVSMDGRRETVYPDSIYDEWLEFYRGTGDWDSLLEKRPTDLALVPTTGPTFNLLKLKPGWSLVYEDSIAGLFAREGSFVAASLRKTPIAQVPIDGTDLCFP